MHKAHLLKHPRSKPRKYYSFLGLFKWEGSKALISLIKWVGESKQKSKTKNFDFVSVLIYLPASVFAVHCFPKE